MLLLEKRHRMTMSRLLTGYALIQHWLERCIRLVPISSQPSYLANPSSNFPSKGLIGVEATMKLGAEEKVTSVFLFRQII